MPLDSDRLAENILNAWYGLDGSEAGFDPNQSKEAIFKFLRPQIEAIAKQVVNELLANAEIVDNRIT